MFESFLTVTGICAAVYLVWFFWPKIFGSSGAKLSMEEYAWLAIGIFSSRSQRSSESSPDFSSYSGCRRRQAWIFSGGSSLQCL